MSDSEYWKTYARHVIESKYFTAFAMALTIYALTGDDFRLLLFNLPSDNTFNLITILCILLFSFEIGISSWVTADYLFSFFFILDIVSTASLFLDLTWVSDSMLGDEDDINNLRGSRAAKLGARASRMVRVIRLIRVVKLYKTVLHAARGRSRYNPSGTLLPGEEDGLDEVDQRRESRVGKKLSERTTQSVICLLVLMMIVNMALRIDSSERFATSATYGAELIHEAFERMEGAPEDASLRRSYENVVLQYIYYHSWFTGKADNCPVHDRACSNEYDSHLFWMGVMGEDVEVLEGKARLARLSQESVEAWERKIAVRTERVNASWLYNFGPMPPLIQSMLGLRWDVRCPTKKRTSERVGVAFLAEPIEDWGASSPERCPDNLRRSERRLYAPRLNVTQEEYNSWRFVFYFDLRPFVKDEAMYSLLVTLFVCASLCAASVVFSHAANKLVVHPVENMVAKVEAIRDNPLLAVKVAEDREFKREERRRARRARRRLRLQGDGRLSGRGGDVMQSMVLGAKSRLQRALSMNFHSAISETADEGEGTKEGKVTETMETVILERTIVKLGSLLALGFGEAGANIIGLNLQGGDTAAINAMVEGTRVECVIGVARIREFSTATEVLQGRVMSFVNKIAEIVHGVVDEYHGYTNKNNNGKFLMIWRISDLVPVGKLADMSMVATVRILSAVQRSAVLADYRSHPGLQQRLGKDCRVNMSCGLHYGWAIEGAVGSEFKIDASYLSPNVSIAEGVERATRIYGVNLLVAESVWRTCNPAMAAKCRLIDRVIIMGSPMPMQLYVIDFDYQSLSVQTRVEIPHWTARKRFKLRQVLERDKLFKLHDDVHMATELDQNPDVTVMAYRYTPEFVHLFKMGYQNYSQGEWRVAHRFLSKTRSMTGIVDGPSEALLKYMEDEGGRKSREASPRRATRVALDSSPRRTQVQIRFDPETLEAPKSWQRVRDLSHALF